MFKNIFQLKRVSALHLYMYEQRQVDRQGDRYIDRLKC